MQKHLSENLGKLYQVMSKPVAELTELNIHTFNQIAKNNGYLEEFGQLKKPEDLLWAQMKLLSTSQLESINYAKKMGDIWIKALDEFNELFNDILRETTLKTSDQMTRSGQKNKD